MAAKSYWPREIAEEIIRTMLPAFGRGNRFDLCDRTTDIVICGDLRRNPGCQLVKQLCFVVSVKEDVNIPDTRSMSAENVKACFPGSGVRSYGLYQFVELPDGSGNVSWVIVPDSTMGAALVHATGPVEFIKLLETFSVGRGLKFGASGLKKGDDTKITTRTEEELFSALGTRFVALTERDTLRVIDPL